MARQWKYINRWLFVSVYRIEGACPMPHVLFAISGCFVLCKTRIHQGTTQIVTFRWNMLVFQWQKLLCDRITIIYYTLAFVFVYVYALCVSQRVRHMQSFYLRCSFLMWWIDMGKNVKSSHNGRALRQNEMPIFKTAATLAASKRQTFCGKSNI